MRYNLWYTITNNIFYGSKVDSGGSVLLALLWCVGYVGVQNRGPYPSSMLMVMLLRVLLTTGCMLQL